MSSSRIYLAVFVFCTFLLLVQAGTWLSFSKPEFLNFSKIEVARNAHQTNYLVKELIILLTITALIILLFGLMSWQSN